MVFYSLLVSVSLFVLAGTIAYIFLCGFIWGAGFQPTPTKEIDRAAALLDLHEGSLVLDLGSGTGTVLIRLAEKFGARCIGFEIDPLKVWWSRLRIRMKGLPERIEIRRENLLFADISNADVVYVFLSNDTKIMKRLEVKLLNEIKHNGKVVSFVHRFKEWESEFNEGRLYVYSPSMQRMERLT